MGAGSREPGAVGRGGPGGLCAIVEPVGAARQVAVHLRRICAKLQWNQTRPRGRATSGLNRDEGGAGLKLPELRLPDLKLPEIRMPELRLPDIKLPEFKLPDLRLPQLKIGMLRPRWPIIQGGMAIRISTGRLAGAVADAGGIGIIAGTAMSEEELGAEIRIARAIAPKGIIGVNVMFAIRRFAELVHAAIDEGIDVVISGAGFSRDMFAWGRAGNVAIVPIVGSAKLARVSQDLGAAAVVVEGKEAGGHLGTDRSVEALVPEICEAVDIPVIAAGGIVEAADVVKAFDMGADGVQMGIRFAASKESNAADALKEVYLRATDEDILLIPSPVGLPGRAIRNRFTEDLAAGRLEPVKECIACLKKCSRTFCIRDALCRAQQGDVETGLIFSGQYVGRVREVLPAKEIIDRLVRQVLELRAAALAKRIPVPTTAAASGAPVPS